jgi:hypothetical protein
MEVDGGQLIHRKLGECHKDSKVLRQLNAITFTHLPSISEATNRKIHNCGKLTGVVSSTKFWSQNNGTVTHRSNGQSPALDAGCLP